MPVDRRAARFRRTLGAAPWVFGHRGARHDATENTLSAFELARIEGAAGVELDVRLSEDGELVVFHDPNLSRATGGRLASEVEDLPSSTLRSIDVGAGERVPLLSEALDWATEHDLCLNIEVKSDVRNKRRLLDAVVRCLSLQTHARERLLLSSFHPGFVRALAAALPAFGVCWLVHARQRLLRSAPGYRWLGAIGVNPEHRLLNEQSVQRWKRSEALLATWTVNQPELALGYAGLGVDAIISDSPGRILQALAARGREKAGSDSITNRR